jgi:peroxiredoxin
VFGLSSQDTDYQREMVQRLRLPFSVLSDPDLVLADRLELPTFQAAGTTLYKRITLVLRDDAIEHVFYPIFPPNEHARESCNGCARRPLGGRRLIAWARTSGRSCRSRRS